MSELKRNMDALKIGKAESKGTLVKSIQSLIESAGFEIVELNQDKPWGAYFRLAGNQADAFIQDFFPGLSAVDARLGNDKAELSPKFLVVSPGQRLSWQYHNRRAERWAFLTEGAYNKSETDEQGEVIYANPGDVVQFSKGERHRLVGSPDSYTIVAEIWQHTDADDPSNEGDIIRLADDYTR